MYGSRAMQPLALCTRTKMTVTLGPTKLLLLGTFDEYIHSAIFDPLTGQLRAGETTKSSMKPTWLTQNPCVRHDSVSEK